MFQLPNEIAPCGIYCGACPSFNKSCLGCSAQSKEQARGSKWACKVRVCCHKEKGTICADCEDFPCKRHKKKLIDSHPDDPRFAYRHEIPDNHRRMNEMGLDAYLAFQKQRWSCPHCDGRVRFYHYQCDTCGRDVEIQAI